MNRLLVLTALLLLAVAGAQAQTVSILFDNGGDEAGVTPVGTSDFSFMGSNWSDGLITSEPEFPFLYASGNSSYLIRTDGAVITFDEPVTDVSFFFVVGFFDLATATAFAADGTELGTVSSAFATTRADPANFRNFDTEVPIARIEFAQRPVMDSASVDNFTFTIAGDDGGPTDPPPAEPVNFNQVEGNWVNPDPDFANSRQGLMFDFGSSLNLLFVAWFTYTSMPMMPPDDAPMDIGSEDQRWFTALLDIDGNVATGTMRFSAGGEFDAPAPAFLETREAGTLSIEFTACDQATVTYSFDEPSLSRAFEIIPLEKSVNPSGFNCESAGGE
jgi:hypothetical protein